MHTRRTGALPSEGRPMSDSPARQARLIAALCEPRRHGAACAAVRVIETHISYVLLTGEFAYKIKKCIALPFVDFSTLDARRRFCIDELRLNRRLAPTLYLDVVAITGGADDPVVGGSGPACEYAVRMREFPQDALLSRELERGQLSVEEIDALAAMVAAFHATIPAARADGPFGTPEDILRYARANFLETGAVADTGDRDALAGLRHWTEREFAAREGMFESRRRAGLVRECHGDLHLGNIARIDGNITIFDCIEFNEQLRWIDVASEVAFTAMDLEDRGRPDLGARFLDRYLAITGDYAGLGVYRFYVVYRALVRAKIACLRLRQLTSGDERAGLAREFRGYLALAQRHASPTRPAVVITHGLSGSGKTAATEWLLEHIGAIRIRTDVERKRGHGLAASARSGSTLAAGLYAADATRATYARVCAFARAAVTGGFCTIIDGTFLMRWQRDAARALAAELRVPFVIVSFAAADATLRQRIVQRAAAATDASEADAAVLARQRATQEPPGPDEAPFVVTYDAQAPLGRSRDPRAWQDVLARIGIPEPAH
jgi:aminoglycoside phosphotransferase family enzyme/predicted kinase